MHQDINFEITQPNDNPPVVTLTNFTGSVCNLVLNTENSEPRCGGALVWWHSWRLYYWWITCDAHMSLLQRERTNFDS